MGNESKDTLGSADSKQVTQPARLVFIALLQPFSGSESSELLLSGLRWRRVVQDPLQLELQLPGGEQPAGPVDPQAKVAPLVVDGDVFAVQLMLEHI